MKLGLTSLLILFVSLNAIGQNFQLLDRQDSYQATINETVRIPFRIKNATEKAQFYVIRKTGGELGGSQKGYFCLDKTCLEPGIEEFSKRVEAGETLHNLYYVVETGLQASQSSVRFEVFVKGHPNESVDHTINLVVEEKPSRSLVYQSKEITVHDIFPNPIQNEGFMDYKIHQEQVKAKVVVHNILGKTMGEYDLSFQENRVKILADELASGIYFYTIYIDNNGVTTRKMIVRK